MYANKFEILLYEYDPMSKYGKFRKTCASFLAKTLAFDKKRFYKKYYCKVIFNFCYECYTFIRFYILRILEIVLSLYYDSQTLTVGVSE